MQIQEIYNPWNDVDIGLECPSVRMYTVVPTVTVDVTSLQPLVIHSIVDIFFSLKRSCDVQSRQGRNHWGHYRVEGWGVSTPLTF